MILILIDKLHFKNEKLQPQHLSNSAFDNLKDCISTIYPPRKFSKTLAFLK